VRLFYAHQLTAIASKSLKRYILTASATASAVCSISDVTKKLPTFETVGFYKKTVPSCELKILSPRVASCAILQNILKLVLISANFGMALIVPSTIRINYWIF